MIRLARTLTVALARVLFRSRLELMVENLALRQQLAVFKRHCRPRLRPADRVFWVFLRQAWRNWANALIVVEPDTVVGWQRKGFRLSWRLISSREPNGSAVPGSHESSESSSDGWRGRLVGERLGFTANC